MWPNYTEIGTVHIPPRYYLAIAGFNMLGTALYLGSGGDYSNPGAANDVIYCRFGNVSGVFGSSSFGLPSYPVTWETYKMSATLVARIYDFSDRDITLECAYATSENLDAGGHVLIDLAIIYAVEVGQFLIQ